VESEEALTNGFASNFSLSNPPQATNTPRVPTIESKRKTEFEVSMSHDLPHPDPLPKEREKRPPSRFQTCNWIRGNVIRKTGDEQLLFPLPGGEGQGEGELTI